MEKYLQKFNLRIQKRIVLASILFWVPVLLFIEFSEDVIGKEPILIDQPIIDFIRSISSELFSTVVKIATHGGDTAFIFAITVLLVAYLYFKNRQRDMLAVLFTVGGAGLINLFLKLSFQRSRPSIAEALISETGFSFPSGHAMGSSALGFVIIIMFFRTKWRWLAIVLSGFYIFVIGFTRVYLGVHYPSDVVAGWCVSAVWVLTVYVALEHPAFLSRNIKKIIRHR